MFQQLFPEHEIKQDKDTKSNVRVQKGILHANGMTERIRTSDLQFRKLSWLIPLSLGPASIFLWILDLGTVEYDWLQLVMLVVLSCHGHLLVTKLTLDPVGE